MMKVSVIEKWLELYLACLFQNVPVPSANPSRDNRRR